VAEERTTVQPAYGDIAPDLADYTDTVLFGGVWKRPGLSPRDSSLIKVAALVAGYRENEMPGHIQGALANGVTRDELAELVIHLGWPTANTAVKILRGVLKDAAA
jgi:4-carboxymuconolactone decarboxylase